MPPHCIIYISVPTVFSSPENTIPPLWKFPLSITHFFKFVGATTLTPTPTHRKFQSLLWSRERIAIYSTLQLVDDTVWLSSISLKMYLTVFVLAKKRKRLVKVTNLPAKSELLLILTSLWPITCKFANSVFNSHYERIHCSFILLQVPIGFW